MATYYVDSVNGLDANAGTSEALAKQTLAAGVALLTTAGDILYVQAGGNYTLTSTVTLTQDGSTASGRITIEGYTTTPGALDGKPTITSATNSVALFTLNAASYITFRHLNLTHTAGTRGPAFVGATANSVHIRVDDCVIDGCSQGYDGSSRPAEPLTFVNTEIKNCTSHGINNDSAASTGTGGTYVYGCDIHDNGGEGVHGNSGTATWVIEDSILDTNTYGFRDTATSRNQIIAIKNCTIVDNTNDGVEIGATTGSVQLVFEGNVLYGNGAFGIQVADSQTETDARVIVNRRNAYGSNTSGATSGIGAGVGDVTLSGDPFTDRAGRDFRPDNTAGEGASLRAAGPAPRGQTNNNDIGAIHHVDPAGGAAGMLYRTGGG